jgi:hypothetical protein
MVKGMKKIFSLSLAIVIMVTALLPTVSLPTQSFTSGEFEVVWQIETEALNLIEVSNGIIGIGNNYIAKYDYDGNIVWENNKGNGLPCHYYADVLEISEGFIAVGYFIGTFFTANFPSKAFVIKYDRDGNLVWEKRYEDSYNSSYNALTDVSDGVIVSGLTRGELGGNTRNGVVGVDSKGLLVKYDYNGNMVWEKAIYDTNIPVADFSPPYRGEVRISNLVTVSDGFIAAVNYAYCADRDFRNSTLMKFDFDGNMIWEKKTFNYSSHYLTLVDGGLVALRRMYLNEPGLMLTKYDLNGNLVWDKPNDSSMLIPASGGFIECGKRICNTVRKRDASGNILWENSFDLVSIGYALPVIELSDGLIVLGSAANGTRITKLIPSSPPTDTLLPAKTFSFKSGKTIPADAAPLAGAYINTTAKTLTIPAGYNIEAYSTDGGMTWTAGTLTPEAFEKLFDRSLELWLCFKDFNPSAGKPQGSGDAHNIIAFDFIPLTIASPTPGAVINLSTDTIALPTGFTVAAYSTDGGRKWKRGELPNAARFPRLLNKGMTLHVTDDFDRKDKKPTAGAETITFPEIAARPKRNADKLRPFYGETHWVLAKRGTTAAVFSNLEYAPSSNGKTPDGNWIPMPEDGIPVSTSRDTYLVRTAPTVTTAASAAWRVRTAAFGKAPNLKVKNDEITVNAGMYVKLPDGTVTLYREKKKIPAVTGMEIWRAANGKKPASEVQTLT